jgi:hypothetical protein
MTRKTDVRDDALEVTHGAVYREESRTNLGQKWGLLLGRCTMTMSNVCWFITTKGPRGLWERGGLQGDGGKGTGASVIKGLGFQSVDN